MGGPVSCPIWLQSTLGGAVGHCELFGERGTGMDLSTQFRH
jgi:hypothetical protein